MNDEFLTKFRQTPRPEFAASLYERINKPMQTRTSTQGMRFAALTLSIFLVLTMALVFSSSARSFAQSVLRQIGGYSFNQGVPQPIDASRLPAAIHISETDTSISIQLTGESSMAAGLASASDMAGFPVRTPSYLPSGYIPMDGGWSITPEDDSTAVTNGYYDTTKNYFFLTQWEVGEGDATRTFTREEIVDVSVRGQNGVWLPQATAGGSTSALVWAEGGVTYSLISKGLPLDEMLLVAESLGQ
jgi:hypothetical protein